MTKDKSKRSRDDKLEFYLWPGIMILVLLSFSFFPWPYGFYTFLKIVVTAVSIYYAYYLYEVMRQSDIWFWILVAIVILFNPIFPIYLHSKALWGGIDIVVMLYFVFFLIKFKK